MKHGQQKRLKRTEPNPRESTERLNQIVNELIKFGGTHMKAEEIADKMIAIKRKRNILIFAVIASYVFCIMFLLNCLGL